MIIRISEGKKTVHSFHRGDREEDATQRSSDDAIFVYRRIWNRFHLLISFYNQFHGFAKVRAAKHN